MIQIPKKIIEEIFAHARTDAPIEACGYLTGKEGLVFKRYPMRNVDASPEHFTLDPKEQLQVIKQARAEGQTVLSVYHTHPASPARPSEEDIRLAFDPNISYVIASLLDEKIRSFRIEQGLVTMEELHIFENNSEN
jgi:proteasome lid subunit RPN8/RPN11